MAKIFKTIGKGLLYAILFPFIIVGIIFYGVISFVIFLGQLIKIIYLFFTGRTLFSDTDEDIKAKQIIQAQSLKKEAPVHEDILEPTYVETEIFAPDESYGGGNTDEN